MNLLDALFLLISISFALSSLTLIGMLLYLGRWHVKQVDKVVYGFEWPNDNIFALLVRVPSYAGAFTFEWSAKRSGLTNVVAQFDHKFRLPFIFTFWIGFFSILALLLSSLMHKVFL